MSIREENGKKIADILKSLQKGNVRIRTRNEWELQLYYSGQVENTMYIEMCLTTSLGGDPLFDPLMRIALDLDAKGRILSARPLYYLSQTPFCHVEIYSAGNPDCYDPKLYEKAGELDERLAELLVSLRIQGYLTEGTVTPI